MVPEGTELPYLDLLDDLLFGFGQDGNMALWNQAVVEVTGYSEAELATMSAADFFEEPDASRVAEAAAEVFDTGEAVVEAALLTADGERIPYEFRARRVPEERPVAVVGLGRDISTRKAVDRERRAILDRMADAFFAVDADWRVTYTNEQGAQLLGRAMGYDPGDTTFEGRQFWAELPEAVETTFYEQYHRAMDTGEPVSFEEYYEPLDTWYDVRVFPSETGLSVYAQNITERRRQRDQLEHREAVLKELYRITADRDRSFTEQVEALLALGRRELDTEYGSLSEIQGDEYRFEVVDAADESISPGDIVPLEATNCELTASREQTLVLGDVSRDAPEETDRAGYTEWGISCYVGAPVYDNDGVYGTFCFYDTEPRDGQFSDWEVTLVDLMSRWVSYELQRRQITERLQQQNEKLEQFAGIVSHDLRNPLNALRGWLDMAEETGDPEHFARCYSMIDRMETLIEDLLTLARTGSEIDDVEPVALGPLAEQAWAAVGTTGATLSLETDLTVTADESRLRQLLENLFRNSVEHGSTSPASQAQQDSGEHGDDAVTVTVGALDDGFYVADDGPGIPADEREVVLEGGHSTNPDGTGFGLTIVQEIARAHGWDVRVTESATGGARFDIVDVDIVE